MPVRIAAEASLNSHKIGPPARATRLARRYTAQMPGRFICDRCGNTIPPHAHYIVKMQVYADPSLPAVTADDIEEADYQRRMTELLRQMENRSAQQLEDDVYWQREFKICRECQLTLIRDPLSSVSNA
jgi:hypothetical protein